MQLRAIETDAREERYLVLQLHLEEGVTDYAAAMMKRNRLQDEIIHSHASEIERANMLHTVSKLWMFLAEFVPQQVKDEWSVQGQKANQNP